MKYTAMSSTGNRQSARYTITKQGYLNKLPNTTKLFASLKKPERRWFVFGFVNGMAYLEYYNSPDDAFRGVPINIIALNSCCDIVRNQRSRRYNNVFCLVLSNRHLSLVAQSRTEMLEWCTAIEQKLQALRILSSGENDYTSNITSSALYGRPALERSLRPVTLHQSSTLNTGVGYRGSLPVHLARAATLPATNRLSTLNNANDDCNDLPRQMAEYYNTVDNACATENSLERGNNYNDNEVTNTTGYASATAANDDVVLRGQFKSEHGSHTICDVTYVNEKARSKLLDDPTYVNDANTNVMKDRLVVSSSFDPVKSNQAAEVLKASLSNLSSSSEESDGCRAKIDARQDYEVSLFAARTNNISSRRSGYDVLPLPASKVLHLGARSTLKQHQVEELQAEIDDPNGLAVVLSRSSCLNSIGLVDCFNAVWIAGWNPRSKTLMQTVFHVGDRLLSINGQIVIDSKAAYKILDDSSQPENILSIRRLPLAKVIVVKREVERQELGLHRLTGSLEIVYVNPVGLAAKFGFPAKAKIPSSKIECNWSLTEINGQSLNLYITEEEIQGRLNAAGLEISLTLLPVVLVKEFQEQVTIFPFYKLLLHSP